MKIVSNIFIKIITILVLVIILVVVYYKYRIQDNVKQSETKNIQEIENIITVPPDI